MTFNQWLTGCTLLLCSFCNHTTVYTAEKKLTNNIWHRQSVCIFDIDIHDLNQAYDIDLLLEYTSDFPYQNLHVTYQLQSDHSNLVDPVLTNHLLFDAKTGKALGKGWGDKKCLHLPLLTNYHFEQPGHYKVGLVQFMRTEQLPGIARVGIQLHKYQQKQY